VGIIVYDQKRWLKTSCPLPICTVLLKGFEIEVYTGTPAGDAVGLSNRIVADLDGFMTEPDSRNVEYATDPLADYEQLLCALLKPRQQLREYLKQLGDYTLIPGSTLSLGGREQFMRSDPNHPYHTFIEQTYGTNVVTASVHINIGIDDPELLLRACRLVRVEAPLYLALSASSPFLDGKPTAYHSTRWGMFPKTPAQVPLFTSHQHFIDWTEEQLAIGTMQNVRHLWSSVRPNGDRRPYELNRLELRICDLIIDPIALLAVTALLEARIWQLMANPDLDPLVSSKFTPAELVDITNANEAAAAQSSLEATLQHWQDGRLIIASDWIQEMQAEVAVFAEAQGFKCFLTPVQKILTTGNTAQQWLQEYALNHNSRAVVVNAIEEMRKQELDLAEKACQSVG
jgi:predicted glutamate--cysteine ligase